MTFQVYEFTAFDPNANNEYTFKGYLLLTGEVLIPAAQTNDEFFSSLDEVEAHGNDEITKYEATGRTIDFTDDEFRTAVTGSASEFGASAVPESLNHWLN